MISTPTVSEKSGSAGTAADRAGEVDVRRTSGKEFHVVEVDGADLGQARLGQDADGGDEAVKHAVVDVAAPVFGGRVERDEKRIPLAGVARFHRAVERVLEGLSGVVVDADLDADPAGAISTQNWSAAADTGVGSE